MTTSTYHCLHCYLAHTNQQNRALKVYQNISHVPKEEEGEEKQIKQQRRRDLERKSPEVKMNQLVGNELSCPNNEKAKGNLDLIIKSTVFSNEMYKNKFNSKI
ncbi:unnamed protein product [Heterobilharzia americana]|nr:unnamed protein product [Heterobilharzia americana]